MAFYAKRSRAHPERMRLSCLGSVSRLALLVGADADGGEAGARKWPASVVLTRPLPLPAACVR